MLKISTQDILTGATIPCSFCDEKGTYLSTDTIPTRRTCEICLGDGYIVNHAYPTNKEKPAIMANVTDIYVKLTIDTKSDNQDTIITKAMAIESFLGNDMLKALWRGLGLPLITDVQVNLDPPNPQADRIEAAIQKLEGLVGNTSVAPQYDGDLYDIVKRVTEAPGMDQKTFAKYAEMSQGTVSLLVNKKIPISKTVREKVQRGLSVLSQKGMVIA